MHNEFPFNMILCSVSIQVRPDLVVCYNRIRAGICCGFFTAVVLFFSLLFELASSFMTQIPSDKLKMIDSESKMETAPQGASKCPHLCPRSRARFECMHVHRGCTVTSIANPRLTQACDCCRRSLFLSKVCTHVCGYRNTGWLTTLGS